MFTPTHDSGFSYLPYQGVQSIFLSAERCTHGEDVRCIKFEVKDVWQDVGTQLWGTTRWKGKAVFNILRDKRLHPQPLQSRNGKATSGTPTARAPIASFAENVQAV